MTLTVPSGRRFRRVQIALVAVGTCVAALLPFAAEAADPPAKPPAKPAAKRTPPEPADLQARLEVTRARHGTPGLGAAVVRGADVIAIGVAGTRRAGDDDKVTIDDRWHLGSCTKAFTATLVARLVEAKKLTFDLTLGKAFPEVDVHERFRPVTLEQLLRNRGGAPADLDADGLWARFWERKGTHRMQRMELVRGVLPKEPTVAPGTYTYSNAGFAIVGAAAEEKLGLPWEDLLRRHVLGPLGMASAGFGAPGDGGSEKALRSHPWGHLPRDGELVPLAPGPSADNPPAIGPAATLHCSLRDWARFASVHLRGARGEATGFLTKETFDRLHTPREGHTYALGWIARTSEKAGGLVLAHDGSNTLWYASIQILPGRNVAVVVTANAGDANAQKAVAETASGLLQEYATK